MPAAEAALVVNNCAAALALVATALGPGRELVLARGELVEIGDGFRIPDLLTSTGARLREVGTTNRVTLADYRGALGPTPAPCSRCTRRTSSSAASPGRSRSASSPPRWPAPGCRSSPTSAPGCSGRIRCCPASRTCRSTLAAGADLVLASGDKLLGGPQAGLVLGRAELVQRLRRHPLYRALRVDKTTLAALEATLRGPVPPVQEMLAADLDGLRARARRAGRPAHGRRASRR